MTDVIYAALSALRAERHVLRDRMAKIEQAITVLSNLTESERPPAATGPPSAPASDPGRSGSWGHPSLRSAVVELVKQYPNGMMPRQIMDLLVQAGDPRLRPGKPDPMSPVRTALLTAQRANEVYKGTDGTWHAKAPATTDDRESDNVIAEAGSGGHHMESPGPPERSFSLEVLQEPDPPVGYD